MGRKVSESLVVVTGVWEGAEGRPFGQVVKRGQGGSEVDSVGICHIVLNKERGSEKDKALI